MRPPVPSARAGSLDCCRDYIYVVVTTTDWRGRRIMMDSFAEQARTPGDIGAVWAMATDVPAWPSWDPHEEKARIDGEFAAGTKGWSKPAGAPAGVFTITEVEPERMWASRAGIP